MIIRMGTISSRSGSWHSSTDVPESYGGGSSAQPGCFEIVQGNPEDPEDRSYRLENRYFNVGTHTFEASKFSFTSPEPGMALVLAVNLVSAEPGSYDTEYAWISGSGLMSELRSRQAATNQVAYVPLYLFDGDGSVKCRFVHGIHVVQAYERRGVF